ncbi:TPA_asm: hypothetical protein [Capsaspora MELD virus 1]|nr:TPA_asm: hypothetical protein [Capsaspora MELD virus 1]
MEEFYKKVEEACDTFCKREVLNSLLNDSETIARESYFTLTVSRSHNSYKVMLFIKNKNSSRWEDIDEITVCIAQESLLSCGIMDEIYENCQDIMEVKREKYIELLADPEYTLPMKWTIARFKLAEIGNHESGASVLDYNRQVEELHAIGEELGYAVKYRELTQEEFDKLYPYENYVLCDDKDDEDVYVYLRAKHASAMCKKDTDKYVYEYFTRAICERNVQEEL